MIKTVSEFIDSNGKQGEVAFTKSIAENKVFGGRLCECVNHNGDFDMDFEVVTKGGKKIDDVIYSDSTRSEVLFVVEAQDSTGWLDEHHIFKTMNYCHDQGTTDAILICDSVTEHNRDKVKWINEGRLKFYIVHPIITEQDGVFDVDFKLNLRPEQFKPNTRVVSSESKIEEQAEKLKLYQSMLDKYKSQGNSISHATKTYLYFNVNTKGIKSITLRINSASYDVRAEGSNQYKTKDIGHTKLAEQLSNFTEKDWIGNKHDAHVKFAKNKFSEKEVVGAIEQIVDFIKSDAIL